MNSPKVEAVALLPADEARHLVVLAAEQGVSTPEMLGYYILKSAYGELHPEVIAYEKRANLGQTGPQEG